MMFEIDSTFVCWIMAFLTPIIYYCYSLCSQAMIHRANRNTIDQYARIFSENKDIISSFGNGMYQLITNNNQLYYENQHIVTIINNLTSFLESVYDESYSEDDYPCCCENDESDDDNNTDCDESDDDEMSVDESDDDEMPDDEIEDVVKDISNNINKFMNKNDVIGAFEYVEDVFRSLKDNKNKASYTIIDNSLNLLAYYRALMEICKKPNYSNNCFCDKNNCCRNDCVTDSTDQDSSNDENQDSDRKQTEDNTEESLTDDINNDTNVSEN